MKLKHYTGLGMLCLAVALQPALARDIASGELLGQNCAACHGTEGRVFNEAMPALAGMDREVFIRAMKDYREGRRPAVVMDRIAKAFNDAEIEAMANWFASRPATPYGGNGDE